MRGRRARPARAPASGEKNLIVMGDLNEGPDGAGNPAKHFAPLYAPTSPLVDVFSLPAFDPGPRPGTFQSCSTTNRLDYIFVTKNLAPHVTGGGIERHGLWGTPRTRIRPKTGTSTQASQTPARRPPTTQRSSSTSTFETRQRARSAMTSGCFD